MEGEDMIDFLKAITFGVELKAYGKTWIQIEHLRENWYLAVEKEAIAPAPVMMINIKPHEQIGGDND